MNDENIEHWIDRAQIADAMSQEQPIKAVKVIKNQAQPKSRGQMIMAIADLLLPDIQKLFAGKRDKDGMLLQPAHARGVALNYAEYYVKATTEENIQG